IRAGLIHAIGAGCTILEVQEPTDFTIQPERWCGDTHISYEEEYIGLDKSTALDCFDYSMVGQKALASAKITPKTVKNENGVLIESLISYEHTPCFAENRITLSGGTYTPSFGPSVWIVLEGNGTLEGENYSRNIAKGDYFFLPFAAQNRFTLRGDGLVLVECLPGKDNL
ncbi:MAG: mannose-6-phosphate isomerase, partial [Clostridia bacterium]|nr:mannose-6-phosphate isomerase [Clostridia bacterium]